MSKTQFITDEKLFFTFDDVDHIISGNIFMKNNLLLTAVHCVQDGHNRSFSGNLVRIN